MYILGITAVSAIFNQAHAVKLSDRQNGFEITLNPRYINGKSISGSHGESADLKSTWGWGFGFGYNFTEHWNLAFDIGWSSQNFNATIVNDDNEKESITGTSSNSSTYFTGTYNILDKTITPYVSGALGWVFMNSNVASGPPQNGCWWYPYWGYICGSYTPTYGTTEFSYGLGLGVRWDVGRTVFLKAAYNKMWIDNIGNVGRVDFDSALLTIGFLLQ